MVKIPNEIQLKIVEMLVGTPTLINDTIRELVPSITAHDIKELMLDNNYDLCHECKWWVEVCELHETRDGFYICDNCYGYSGERNDDS